LSIICIKLHRGLKSIIKQRNIPYTLRVLNALVPRISNTHSMYEPLKIQAAKAQKGLNGERKLDYHLRMLPSTNYSVLNDISFELRDITFQINTCIVSKNAIYINDTKNIEGEADFSTKMKNQTQKHKNKKRKIK